MTAGCALGELAKNYSDTIGPEQDDYAAMTEMFFADTHANDSFERGSTLFWGVGGGGSLTAQSGDSVDGGSWYGRLYGYGGYMYQSVRLTDPGTTLQSRLNHKKFYSTS